MEAKDGLRDKLARVEADLEALRDQRPALVDKRDAARKKFASADGYDINSDEFKEAEAAVRELGELDDKIAEAQAAQVGILKMLGEALPEATPQRNGTPNGDAPQWDSAALFPEAVTRELARHAGSQSAIGTLRLGEVAGREALAADIAPSTEMRRGPYFGILPQLARPLTVLDLIPTATMTGNSFAYTRESGPYTGAAETAEGDLKPEVGVTFTDETAEAQTIAGWMKVRKQALADVAALRGIIDNRLRYIVRRRLEAQIVAGDGTGVNLEGLLTVPGTNQVTNPGGVLPQDLILHGITAVLLSEGVASGTLVNPLDWRDILTQKATGGDEQYYGGGPFTATPAVMWGVPLIPTPAIPQGKALTADFDLAVTLMIREGVQVLMSDSDGDDFRRNRVTILGEMRAALPIWRPEAVAEIDFAEPQP